MVVPEHTQPFVGRRAELTALRAELATVRSGRPRVVLLEGPSGIGKTAMLDHFLADESDFTVLRATGEQWEAFVAYGVVDQLMRLAGVSRARLLAGRSRSLPAEEPIGVGARILEALEDIEQKAPAVIVVDDAQWADVDSLRALLFVARRLVRERVLLLFAHRVEDAVRLPEGLRRLAASRTGITIRLEPLTTGDIRALAAALGVSELSTRAVQRLAAHTAGNPLYATTLLAEVPEERWRTWEPALPAPRTFAVQMLQRLDACTPEARGLVEAAAVLGVTAPLTSAAALAGVTDLVSALDEAVEVGLLQVGVDDGLRDVSFPHPLTRAAVYDQLGPGRRIGLHGAAAGLVEDEGAALRHRVLAATPPDPALAAELEAFAHRESRTGAWAGAAWTLVEASRLSVNREQREHRLLRAVDAMIGAGDLVQAEAFARQVMSFDVAPLRDATMGYLAVLRGRAGGAGALLRAAWGGLRCGPRSRRSGGGCAASGTARGGPVARRRGGGVGAARPGAGGAGRSGAGGGPGAAGVGAGLAGAHAGGFGHLRIGSGHDSRRRRRPGGARPDGVRLAVAGHGRHGDGADHACSSGGRRAACRLGAHRGVVVRVVVAGGVCGGGVG
jgi:hypothetical protein